MPPTARELGLPAAQSERLQHTGKVLWITGLSGAGKTTLAKSLLPYLPPPCVLLDGDDIRQALEAVTGGYDAGSRKKLAFTYARLCKIIAEQNITVLCATISMFHDVHVWNRHNLPGYVEIYLNAPEHIRRERDYKKVYSLNAGTHFPVAGVDFLPELPRDPHITIDASIPVNEITTAVIEHLSRYMESDVSS